MEGVYIREAKFTDVEEILAIRNAYAGRDYLPEFIHVILSRYKGYVAVYDDKIIGFIVAAIVDEGGTLLPRAGRVREDFEGKGIYTMMDKHIMEIYANSVDFKDVCFHDKNTLLVKKFEAGLLNATFERELLAFKAQRRNLNFQTTTHALSNVEELDKTDLEEIFQSEKLCQVLFTEKKIIASFWMPLRVLKGNIDVIFSENGAVLGSCVKEGTDQSKALLSIEHSYNCSLGKIYNLDIYGNNTENLIKHFAHHLNRALQNTTEEIIVFEVFSEPALKSEVTAAMTKLEFDIYNWDVATKMYCIEYKLETS